MCTAKVFLYFRISTEDYIEFKFWWKWINLCDCLCTKFLGTSGTKYGKQTCDEHVSIAKQWLAVL